MNLYHYTNQDEFEIGVAKCNIFNLISVVKNQAL